MRTEKKVIITLTIVLTALLICVYVMTTTAHTARIRDLDALIEEVLADIANGRIEEAGAKVDGIRLVNDDSTVDKKRYNNIRNSLITVIDQYKNANGDGSR